MIYSTKYWILLFVVYQVTCHPANDDFKDVNDNVLQFSGGLPRNANDRQPPAGYRCAGRNYGGRRCCTPENPCDEGEGDCDGAIDGGQNDGNAGCKGDLVCGSNNCKQFGQYYHEKDDCCEKRSPFSVDIVVSAPATDAPPKDQRCKGRNYGGRRCCTPEEPCAEGEGDCDGPLDGGKHDGNKGCQGNLVCGSNNCLKFGNYYHPKDDCCEKPFPFDQPTRQEPLIVEDGWGDWEEWSECRGGSQTRNRYCTGPNCDHAAQTQNNLC